MRLTILHSFDYSAIVLIKSFSKILHTTDRFKCRKAVSAANFLTIKQSGYSNTLYINCLPYQKSVLKAFSGTRIVIGQVRYSKLG
jgi:hypothetical protein